MNSIRDDANLQDIFVEYCDKFHFMSKINAISNFNYQA